MKTILEIQKLDRQIRILEAEVDKCPASQDFRKYKTMMQEGKIRLEQFENQAGDLVKSYNIASNKLPKYQGNAAIVKKKKAENMNLDNVQSLIGEANTMVGELSEESKKVEEQVRRSEEIIRKYSELANKLTEAKMRANSIKAKIEEKRQEVAPKIVKIQNEIKTLEPKVADQEKYAKYKTMKQNGIFPVYVPVEDMFCGGCKVELSLEFIEKLKTKKMMTCEHCGRVIMFDNK